MPKASDKKLRAHSLSLSLSLFLSLSSRLLSRLYLPSSPSFSIYARHRANRRAPSAARPDPRFATPSVYPRLSPPPASVKNVGCETTRWHYEATLLYIHTTGVRRQSKKKRRQVVLSGRKREGVGGGENEIRGELA